MKCLAWMFVINFVIGYPGFLYWYKRNVGKLCHQVFILAVIPALCMGIFNWALFDDDKPI